MSITQQQQSYIDIAKQVIAIEQKAIGDLSARLDHSFASACMAIFASKGRLMITGMGKSGHIGNKIAATFSSTGTPAYFVHPGEALHGDLGMIMAEDVVIAISNSGSTEELLVLAAASKRHGTTIIAMTGNEQSALAKLSDIHLDIVVEEEACPLGLAPTSSTTVTLVLGDALAVALLEARGFTHEDFARSHPAGRLGKRLLVQVRDVMHTGEMLPMVQPDTSLQQAILEMTSKKLGATLVCNQHQTLFGIFTDGDLRRAFKQGNLDGVIGDVMSPCKHLTRGSDLAVTALNIMQEHEITVLPVVNEKQQVEGIIHMHDLFKAGLV